LIAATAAPSMQAPVWAAPGLAPAPAKHPTQRAFPPATRSGQRAAARRGRPAVCLRPPTRRCDRAARAEEEIVALVKDRGHRCCSWGADGCCGRTCVKSNR
jgi:hypothetical protein